MKKTKIICSIGPSSCREDVFEEMVLNGCNVARINFSHATLDEREKTVDLVRKVSEKLQTEIGILYDTKGPEFRNGILKDGKIELIKDKFIKVVKDDVIGDQEKFSVNYPSAIDSLSVGDIILLENGLMSIQVVEKNPSYVNCKVINGGILGNKKSLSVPGVKLDIPFISNEDYEDISYACLHDGDFLACSFVSTKDEVLEVRKILKKYNREDMKIISKIESQTGLDNLEDIISVSDGIMVARGDLGVEVPMEDLPVCQKKIATLCRKYGKICIVATEMLESMKKNSRPTRAEVTDIANAVYMGADAVMLSGETTTGNYPIEAVHYMSNICEHIENTNSYNNDLVYEKIMDVTDAITKSAYISAKELNAKLIVIPTVSGTSARKVSNYIPSCEVLALTTSKSVARSLTLNYGVFPKIVSLYKTTDEVINNSIIESKLFKKLEKGDNIIITGGFNNNKSLKDMVKTNLLKIEVI